MPGERDSAVNWPLWLGAGLLSCAILGSAVGFHYWRRAKLAARDIAPEAPQLLEPVPAELRPLIQTLTLPFAADGLEGDAPHPSVIVDGHAVYVGAQQVALLEPLQQKGRLQRIDPLFNTMKGQRETWKAAHPGAEFDSLVDYWIDEKTSMLLVKDVFQTGGFAGFPNVRFMVRSRSKPLRAVALPVDARVPGPPGEDKPPPVRILAVCLGADDNVELAWAGEGLELLERKVPLQDLKAATKALWSGRPPSIGQPTAQPKPEEAIVFVPHAAPFHKLVALLDGLNEPKLAFVGGKPDDFPAFNTTLIVHEPEGGAKKRAEEYQHPQEWPSTPRARFGATKISGRLAPEVIQKAVRASFGATRSCYEKGLDKNPQLTGRVTVRFVIGRDGRVTSSELSPESTLPDAAVQSCIARAFASLKFPPPEGGIVTVVYPVMLEPG